MMNPSFADDRRSPGRDDILRRLRDLEPRLRQRGIAALWLFGSVARGDAGPGSDVDVALEFVPDGQHSLLDLVHIKAELEEALGYPVDVGERRSLRSYVREAANPDMLGVF